jgi:hypothetical protein
VAGVPVTTNASVAALVVNLSEVDAADDVETAWEVHA